MRVEQEKPKPPFKPIKITLESSEEVATFKRGIREHLGDEEASQETRLLFEELSAELK